MKFQNARQRLDDTTFLLGAFRRRAALKELRESPDPDAAETLVDAIDLKSASAEAAKGVLAAKSEPAWTDRLWEIWAKRRRPWLGSLLEEGGAAHTQP